MIVPYLAISFLVSFLTTLAFLPWLIRKAVERGFWGIDLHKLDRRKVASIGGVTFYAGVLASCTLTGLYGLDDRTMLGMLLASSLGALIGLLDDMFGLSKSSLTILTFLIGMPIVTYRLGSTMVYLTPVGPADLGVLFWILVPFIFAYYTNSVNIYAGFNGLEAGLGLITSLSLGVAAFIYGSYETAALLFSLAGGLAAFLRYNWYPARVFPGNVGTYFIGAVYASAIIAGIIKMAGIIATIPYFVNFILRLLDRFKWSVGETTEDGLVYAGEAKALWALFMKRPTHEKRVVMGCLGLQTLFGLATIVFSYLHKVYIVELLGI